MDVAVVGLGLIGGSILRALAAAGHQVTGYDADPKTRAVARALGAEQDGRWRVADTVRDAVAGAGLVVMAVPLPIVVAVLDELVDAGYPGLVTDVTSVKAPVRDLVRCRRQPAGPLTRFVGGHPMAGRESSGFVAADPGLFRDRAWVLCLEPDTPLVDWLELAAVVTNLGARVVPATAAEHDRAVAGVSHVPHLLASAMAATAMAEPLAGTLAAGSFHDGTRVAASPPELIAAMCGGNALAVGPALDAVLDSLQAARDALRAVDPVAALRPWLGPGTAARANWPPRPGSRQRLPAQADALLDLGRAGGWVASVADDRRTVTAVRPACPGQGDRVRQPPTVVGRRDQESEQTAEADEGRNPLP